MSFLPQLPANGPPWLPRFASSIADLFRRVLPAPLKLFSSPTADLPPAADYLGGIIHDSTADTLKIALGAGWSSFSLSTHVHAASTVTFAPSGGIAATDVQAAIVELDTEKLAASSYTAADVLAKLLTVDGAGSGLDADLLDGMSSAAFATAVHSHAIADVTGLQAALDAKLDDTQASTYGLTLLDDADAAAARTTLGLGTAATQNTGTSGAAIPLLDGANTWSARNIFTGSVRVQGSFSGMSGTGAIQLGYFENASYGALLGSQDWSASLNKPFRFIASSIRFATSAALGDGTVRVTISDTGIDVAGLVQCDTFRIDATPTAAAVAQTHHVPISINGVTYKLLLAS